MEQDWLIFLRLYTITTFNSLKKECWSVSHMADARLKPIVPLQWKVPLNFLGRNFCNIGKWLLWVIAKQIIKTDLGYNKNFTTIFTVSQNTKKVLNQQIHVFILADTLHPKKKTYIYNYRLIQTLLLQIRNKTLNIKSNTSHWIQTKKCTSRFVPKIPFF